VAATKVKRICKNMARAWISTNCMDLNELSTPCVEHLLFLFQVCACDKGVEHRQKYGAVMDFNELSSPLEQRQNWIKKADQYNERGDYEAVLKRPMLDRLSVFDDAGLFPPLKKTDV